MTAVVLSGGVTATAAAGFTAGAVIETPYTGLEVGGKAVLTGASCTFTNTNSGATTPVTLTAGSTVLQVGSSGVLLDGAQEQVAGNTLAASSSAILSTA